LTATHVECTLEPFAAPPDAPLNVTLTQGDDTWASLANFVARAPPPNVSAVSPAAGPAAGGFAATLLGTGFRPPVDVVFHFGDTANGAVVSAIVTAANATHVVVTAPPGEIGARVDVAVTNWDGETGTLADALIYQVRRGWIR